MRFLCAAMKVFQTLKAKLSKVYTEGMLFNICVKIQKPLQANKVRKTPALKMVFLLFVSPPNVGYDIFFMLPFLISKLMKKRIWFSSVVMWFYKMAIFEAWVLLCGLYEWNTCSPVTPAYGPGQAQRNSRCVCCLFSVIWLWRCVGSRAAGNMYLPEGRGGPFPPSYLSVVSFDRLVRGQCRVKKGEGY